MCKKQRNLTILLLLALCCVSGWSLLAGLVPISPAHVLHGELTLLEKSVLEHLRLPRLLLGLGTGAALATSGAVLQGVFGNPLADPGILGVSSGAALGAVITLLFGLPQLHFMWLPLGAFCGALLACACVAFLGRGGQDNRLKLLLSGVAVSLFLRSPYGRAIEFCAGCGDAAVFFLDAGEPFFRQLAAGTGHIAHTFVQPLYGISMGTPAQCAVAGGGTGPFFRTGSP